MSSIFNYLQIQNGGAWNSSFSVLKTLVGFYVTNEAYSCLQVCVLNWWDRPWYFPRCFVVSMKSVQNAIWWTNLQLPHINLSYCAALLITVVCEHMDTVIMNHQITLTYKHKIYKLHTEETCVCNQCWGIIIYLVNSYFFKPQWFWFLSSANEEIERSAEPCHTQIF